MTDKTLRSFGKAVLGREFVKLALRPFLRWRPLKRPEPGFSIVLGVPWDLRHLLPVNLKFVAGTDLTGLHAIHVVFDRKQRPEMNAIESDARARFPNLPLRFAHYPTAAGSIVEAVNVSTFYNSMNCATALANVRTRYALMHDFDLYPIVRNYFQEVIGRLQRDRLHFCGLQRTNYDGLTDADNILGTWCLAVDVEWLRRTYVPIDIFHKVESVRSQWVTLDPFSAIQRRTPERSLVESIDVSACCHVGNLCATYLRFRSGQRVKFAWKLHYLWYLEAVNGDDRLVEITAAMDAADDGILRLPSGFEEDFVGVDPRCANVLRDGLTTMDRFLHGECRPHVARYVDAFQEFLSRARARVASR